MELVGPPLPLVGPLRLERVPPPLALEPLEPPLPLPPPLVLALSVLEPLGLAQAQRAQDLAQDSAPPPPPPRRWPPPLSGLPPPPPPLEDSVLEPLARCNLSVKASPTQDEEPFLASRTWEALAPPSCRSPKERWVNLVHRSANSLNNTS